MNFGKKQQITNDKNIEWLMKMLKRKKRGPKPKNTTLSTSASDNEESNKITKFKTKSKQVEEDIPKNRVGRPYKVKFEQLLLSNKTDIDNTPNNNNI